MAASSRGIPSPFYRVSVKALVFDAAQRLLVVQERRGRWQVPGGGWEHDESLEACVRRELDEELGVAVASIDTRELHPCVGAKRLKLTVRAELAPGDLHPGDGMTAAHYVTREQFSHLELGGGDEILKDHILEIWPSR